MKQGRHGLKNLERVISMIKFTIPITPISKKNHQQIIYNRHTGKRMVIPSKQYLQYEKDVIWFMPKVETITEPVNIKCVFYMPTKRRVDLVNLEEAILDVLTKYRIIQDDNCNIVYSMDGSYVAYDRDNPRTEVEIWKI